LSEMAVSLHGDLETLDLPDVIRLMHVSKKTGAVWVRRLEGGEEREEGVLYFRQGQMVSARTDLSRGEAALQAMAGWEGGQFRFEPGAETEIVDVERETDAVVAGFESAREEWRQLRSLVAHGNVVPRLVSDLGPGRESVEITAEQWRLIPLLDGRRTVDELASLLGCGELMATRLVASLVRLGVVQC